MTRMGEIKHDTNARMKANDTNRNKLGFDYASL